MFKYLIVLGLCTVELMHAAAAGQVQPTPPRRGGCFGSCLRATEDDVQHVAHVAAPLLQTAEHGLLSAGENVLLAALESDKFKGFATGGVQLLFTALQESKPVEEISHLLGVTVTPGANNTSVISLFGQPRVTFNPGSVVNYADDHIVALIKSIAAHHAVNSVLAPSASATVGGTAGSPAPASSSGN